MSENIFKDILAEICEEEIAELNKLPPFKPSLRHKYAMMLIFSSFEKMTRRAAAKPPRASSAHSRPSRVSTRLVILIAVILCAALLAGFILVYVSKSFSGPVNEDNTQLFAINTENCPETIEYEYYLPELPEGFEMMYHSLSSFDVYTNYKNELTGKTIMLYQSTKNIYERHFNTEGYEFEDIEINNHEGVFIDRFDSEYTTFIIIWDNGDYILELIGNLPKNDLINLAKSAKILEK